MNDSNSASPRVLELADEFLDRYRRGERPPLGEYTARYPELADEIREVFPAMAIMERIALADESIEGRRLPPGPSRRLELRKLGDFRILREVGRGGMGVVYEAEQVSLGRHVALKVLPDRLLEDPKQRGRFEREAKAAARLHHTNIVPVFGVGEDDGTPYYAMQFIAGLGLDQVIREVKRQRSGPGPDEGTPVPAGPPGEVTVTLVARSLLAGRLEAEGHAGVVDGDATMVRAGFAPAAPAATRAGESNSPRSSGSILGLGSGDGSRLDDSPRPTYWRGVARIGSQVADALAYAHSQGILHRDIKPSNLLIDAHGIVWVTDFGLAKVEDQEGLTHTGDILGTLRYMPPEAFEGRHDARGDVYSLGLSLYEMLAFRPAYDEVDRHRLVRQVTTGEPLQLRTLNPEVPRDLETVIHKAIEREPSHRYQTAAALAEDLRRYMEDRPILARRASESEKLRRWCRRNPTPAVLLATLFVVFWAGFGLVAWKWREAVAERQKAVQSAELAERQRGRAEDREAQAIEAVKRFRDAVANEPELKNNPALEALRKRLLGEPLAFFKGLRDRLQADQDTRPESLFRLAQASYDLATLTTDVGDKRDALSAHAEALAIRRKLAEDHPSNLKYQCFLAESYNSMGSLLLEAGSPAEALKAYESAQATGRKAVEAVPSMSEFREFQAMTYANIGILMDRTGRPAEAVKAHESALAIFRELVQENPSVAKFRLDIARTQINLGNLRHLTGKMAEALKAYESALATLREEVEAHPSAAEYRSLLAGCQVNYAIVLKTTGKMAEARGVNESALATYRELAEAHPSATEYQLGLARSFTNIANTLPPAEAVEAFESALAVSRKLAEANPSVAEFQRLVADNQLNLGNMLGASGKPAEAAEACEAALTIYRKLAELHPSVLEFRSRLGTCQFNLGNLLKATGKSSEALKAYESAESVLRKLATEHAESPDVAGTLGATQSNLALFDMDAGRLLEARERLREAVTWQRKALAANPAEPVYRQYLHNHFQNLRNVARRLKDPEGVAEAEREMLDLRDSDPSIIALDARLAAIIKGDRQPDGEADRLALAQRAYEKALHATAARLQSEALAANPALANDRQAQPRYNSACFAALAGSGKSKDDPPPDNDARAEFRKQALDWLNLELATWSKIVEVGPPQARPFVIQILTHWKGDPDLAGIRDAEPLEKLADGERSAFRKLWTDVDALLKKAAGGQ